MVAAFLAVCLVSLSRFVAGALPQVGLYALRNVENGLFLNVEGGSLLSGTKVWDNPGSNHTQWLLRAAGDGDGVYTLENINSGMLLAVAEGSEPMGAPVMVRDEGAASQQQWRLTEVAGSDGTVYQIQNVGNDLFLNVAGGSLSLGASVHLWDNPGSAHSQWKFGRLWDGDSCLDATADSKCYREVMWAMEHGIHQHPEWYPELTEQSNFREFQAHLFGGQHHDCSEPCCHDSVPGELCHEHATWVKAHGINMEEEAYPPSLTNASALVEFQAYLHLCHPQSCPEPCAHTEVQARHTGQLDCPDQPGRWVWRKRAGRPADGR